MAGKSSSKVRAFSIMTYCSKEQIHTVLGSHNSSIRAYAYIYHDKDETVPHHHIVLRTFDAWSIASIEKWFRGFMDEKGEPINTFVQKANDLHALYEYLTHTDADSIEEGKHQYSKADIYDGGILDLVPKKDAADDTYEIINHMVNGAPTRWLVRRYGKAFIYHYSQFVAVKEAIEREDWMEQSRLSDARQGYKTELKPIPLDQESLEI